MAPLTDYRAHSPLAPCPPGPDPPFRRCPGIPRALSPSARALPRRVLAAGPTRAYAVAKTLIHQAAGVDRLDYHLDEELAHLARIADGADFSEGLAAFFDKRAPAFEGRG